MSKSRKKSGVAVLSGARPEPARQPGDMDIVESTAPDWCVSHSYEPLFHITASDYFTADQALEMADEIRALVAKVRPDAVRGESGEGK